jgi:hypothetical protein
MLAEKQTQSTNLYTLELSNIGVKKVSLYNRWVYNEKIQQRKRKALLTVIFLAYPYFAW